MRIFTLAVVFSVFLSCGSEETAAPPLSEEKIIPVLVDVHLLEAQQQQQQPFEKGRVISTIVGYETIFRKHNITAEQFYDTFAWYRDRPKLMEELYQRVIEDVTRRESELSGKAAAERAAEPADSTKALQPAVNEW
ncbi:MAG TPA: DUF4296 domain-containing protein [Chitinophagales bacterium]|nr:DUF4296 domain-containing protein [Chitinophagales bacterium]